MPRYFRLAFAAAFVAAALMPGAAYAAEARPDAVVTWNQADADVAASCDRVWATLLDRALWQTSYLSRETLSGTFGQAGELALVRAKTGDAANRYERMLVGELGRHMVIGFLAPGLGVTGFVDFRMAPGESRCALTMSLMLSFKIPAGQDGEAFAATMTNNYQDVISGDVQRIKAATEAGAK